MVDKQDEAQIAIWAGQLKSAPISQIANEIRRHWAAPYFGAVPYIKAMLTIAKITDRYLAESGADIVLGFLVNAQTFRGPHARAIKAELNRRLRDAGVH